MKQLVFPVMMSSLLFSVCREGKDGYMGMFYFSDVSKAGMRFTVCGESTTAFTVCENTKGFKHWTKNKNSLKSNQSKHCIHQTVSSKPPEDRVKFSI